MTILFQKGGNIISSFLGFTLSLTFGLPWSAQMASADSRICDSLMVASPMVEEIASLRIQIESPRTSEMLRKVLVSMHDRKVREMSALGIEELEPLIEEAIREKLSEKNLEEKDKRRKRIEEAEVFKVQMIDGSEMIGQRIEPGRFMMGSPGEQVPVEITKPFEMMATVTTQYIWKKVAELAGTKLSVEVAVLLDHFQTKGNLHPVEGISYNQIDKWIWMLNQLSRVDEPLLYKFFPGHKKGDVYRLPTEAEWEFVVRGRGKFNSTYHFGDDKALLPEYAWIEENSSDTTHPVAQKKPLEFDGKVFFDMYGNVWEYVQDWYQAGLKGGKDPLGPAERPSGEALRIARGGDARSAYFRATSDYRNPRILTVHPGFIGFRLVREVQ